MRQPLASEERLDPEALARRQRERLAALLATLGTNPFYHEKLEGITFDPQRDPLDRLPCTTRAELESNQLNHPPYGTNLTFPLGRYTRSHQTSGSSGTPLRWLDTPESWDWWKRCWASVYRGADLSANDRLCFAFSFGPFIGFWSAFEAACGLGYFCLPAGGMTTSARIRYLMDHGVTVVCCTPTYALRMAEVAAEERLDLAGSCVRALIVAGEPGGSVPAVRAKIESSWGARVFDHSGMTEIGAWGFACRANRDALHIIESEFIAEVIDAATMQSVPEGQAGELVLTNLGRIGSPLIRYRTGDIVALTHERCACGRWFARAEGGILGRVDEMLIIRGNNVFPSAIEGILRELTGVAEFRIAIDGRGPMDELCIELEPEAGADAATLAAGVVEAVRRRLHFRPTVTLAAPGALPRFEMKARRVVRNDSDR